MAGNMIDGETIESCIVAAKQKRTYHMIDGLARLGTWGFCPFLRAAAGSLRRLSIAARAAREDISTFVPSRLLGEGSCPLEPATALGPWA